ncbi:MAG: CCA tRNA nucleotidyltransferase [Methanobacteriota archaeon]
MASIQARVLRRVKPGGADIKRVDAVASELILKTNEASIKLKLDARAMLVGSVARGTWLRTEPDIDIFIIFPESLSREELERQGIAVARKVAGSAGRERFAEHPYVTMSFRGLDIDLVPCYDVADPKKIKSAVDRTPHHQRYVESRLTPHLSDEILLLKQFASGVGVYGAELKKQGFSGYLCELLILYHGSFRELVESASEWNTGKIIDVGKSYPDESEPRLLFEKQPFVVIDPVDSNRNAAAAVSLQNFVIFVRACQDFMRKPSLKFFFPRKVKLLGARELDRNLKKRGTRLFCVVFCSPDVVPDVLYPQLRKTERTIVTRLAQEGFEVMRSDVWANSNSAILIEMSVSKLPQVRTRVGPPSNMEAEGFVREHIKSKERLAGPLVDAAGRMVFEMKRDRTDVLVLIKDILDEHAAFGKHVARSVAKGYRIVEGPKLKGLLKDKGFQQFISEYLSRCLPWYR